MLEAINLSKHFDGKTAIDAVTLTVQPGEIYCLLGANGAGTLRQLLSIGITPRQLLWGKALSIGAVLALLLLPVALVLLFVVSVDAEEGTLADTLLRFVVLAFAYALYLGIFLFLALAVSAWSSSSRMALLLLLAIWIVNVMIAPRAVNDLARSRHPTPSRFTFTSVMNDDLYKAWDRLLTDFHATRWADIPPSEFGNSLVAAEAYERQVADRHFNQLWGVFDRQQRVQEWGGILAPLLAIRAASAGLVGTNLAYYRDFVDATERYRRAFETRVNADAAAHGGDQGYNYRAGPELWRQIAPFTYQIASFTWALRHTWPSFTILGLGLLVSLTLTFGALRRLRV